MPVERKLDDRSEWFRGAGSTGAGLGRSSGKTVRRGASEWTERPDGAEVTTGGLFEELSWRGLVAQATDDTLAERLDQESLVLYCGFDPSAPSLHVGNLLGILLLRRLQEAGHRVIALVGGGTGMVGDPSGRDAERTLLETERLAANVAGVRAQLEHLLEVDETPGRPGALVLDNAVWLSSVGLLEFLRDVGKHFTVNQMVAKESVRARLEGREQGISYTEFSYMLLQAYDFLQLHDGFGCTLQVGGSDQWGNITAGVDLVRRARAREVFGLTHPLVVRADGTKFGKSVAGAVWLDPARTSPFAFYQFFLQAEDAVVGSYLRFYTWLSREEIEALDAETAAHPERRAAQRALARALTTLVHGADAAANAERAAAALFSGSLQELDAAALEEAFREAPSSTWPLARLDPPGWALVEVMAACGLVESKGAARRAVAQGGAYVNGVPVADLEAALSRDDLLAGGVVVLRRGKRHQHLLRFV